MLQGLARPQKALPCKYFYDAIGSALFDEICELDEYYLTRTELKILHDHAREMAEAIGEDCDLIEFGSGSGLKTRLLLEAAAAPRAYLPIDISREHLETISPRAGADFPGAATSCPCTPISPPAFRCPIPASRERAASSTFPGSTIGNFSPTAALGLLDSIARLVGAGGGLLIGFDLDKDESIVWPAYNDRRGMSAAFNLNLLARINRELDADFDLDAFAHRADYLRAEERMVMHLVSRASTDRAGRRQDILLPQGRDDPYRGFVQVHAGALRPAHRAGRLRARAAVARRHGVISRFNT